ncbi:MAG: CYTH domain-containing protein [Zhengella sp.]|uniref:CYTH domain-containing protein n=1 Tax=Zhengella sp. TaxID=2282762 RepID=UPI001DAC7538|nr:CYTH domain-containing protein [Notoacmeibacter sp.]MCC0025882.1 CYTH domain-containing protein [Brucellaceae bacterium]
MIEIERKFLVADQGWQASADSGTLLLQGYIAISNGNSVRVRIKGDGSAWLTVKAGSGLVREEYEYSVPVAHARRLLDRCIGNLIEKTRYLVPHEGFVWEVDVFHGALEGAMVCEVEMESEADDPPLPAWCGPEVTGDPRWSNTQLAMHGLPEDAV